MKLQGPEHATCVAGSRRGLEIDAPWGRGGPSACCLAFKFPWRCCTVYIEWENSPSAILLGWRLCTCNKDAKVSKLLPGSIPGTTLMRTKFSFFVSCTTRNVAHGTHRKMI